MYALSLTEEQVRISQVVKEFAINEYAKKIKPPVIYITKRAIFELREDGVYIIEIAPGISYEKDILPHMEFEPKIPETGIKVMDERIFREELMGLK